MNKGSVNVFLVCYKLKSKEVLIRLSLNFIIVNRFKIQIKFRQQQSSKTSLKQVKDSYLLSIESSVIKESLNKDNRIFLIQKMQPSSPPSCSSLSSSVPSNPSFTLNVSHQELLDNFSLETNLSSINTFLSSYQILKKLEYPIIDVRPYLQKSKSHQTHFLNVDTEVNSINQNKGTLVSNGYTLTGVNVSSSLNSRLLIKGNSYHEFKKYDDQISEKETPKLKQELTLSHSKSNRNETLSQASSCSLQILKLPNDNDFSVLQSNIKCSTLVNRIKCITNQEDLNQRPMFTYPQWKQLSLDIKRIFNKAFQTPMKQLNTGQLISLKPKQSLSIRTDYYCFHPHQVYTTFLAFDKTSMNSGTLAFCKLEKEFIDTQFHNFADESELLDSINKEKKLIEWEYLDLKQGNLIVLGKDVLYGSFRNDSQEVKFFAEMRWVRHESASNSSNSS